MTYGSIWWGGYSSESDYQVVFLFTAVYFCELKQHLATFGMTFCHAKCKCDGLRWFWCWYQVSVTSPQTENQLRWCWSVSGSGLWFCEEHLEGFCGYFWLKRTWEQPAAAAMTSSTFMVAMKRHRAMKSSVRPWKSIAAELDKISLTSIHPSVQFWSPSKKEAVSKCYKSAEAIGFVLIVFKCLWRRNLWGGRQNLSLAEPSGEKKPQEIKQIVILWRNTDISHYGKTSFGLAI